jgi:hypothetical protein
MSARGVLAVAVATCLALLAASAPGQAQAAPRGGASVQFGYYGPGHWRGPGYWPGYRWGPGYWGPWYGVVVPPAYGYWPPPYGYLPPAYVVPNPPVYVERDPPAAPVWWYWCAEANAYYPYVKECPGGWQRVPPQTVPPGERP